VQCDLKTAVKQSLNKHLETIHEGIKPFKCSICDYKFSEKGYLKKDIKTVYERIKSHSICSF
jgi:hypothetical protein